MASVLALLLALLGGPGTHGAQEMVNDVGLDPGHSDADVGAVGGGLREVDLTLALARQIRPLLEAHGLRVALTREDNRPLTAMNHRDPTERIRLEQEARIAAVTPARIYVSIHFNGHPNPAIRGTETYYNPDNYGAESRRLAEALQTAILAELRGLGYDPIDRGVRSDLTAGKPYGHFFSLRGPQPSVLVEALFLSNPREAALLREPGTLEALARGYAAGILHYFAASGAGPRAGDTE
jgi:N-acetylmuramoyl-L-alanine amidase